MDLKNTKGSWIQPPFHSEDACPVFRKTWGKCKNVKAARLAITALGVYNAVLNGRRVGDYILAPGWTCYRKRLQYQVYDIKELLEDENELQIVVGKGWFSSPMPGWTETADKKRRTEQQNGIIAELYLEFQDGTVETIVTDDTWQCAKSGILFSEIYDGETYDARYEVDEWLPSKKLDWPKDILIPQEGEVIREQERIAAKAVFVTAAGETVVDFGQEITGYVEFTVHAKAGEEVRFSHGEMLDKDGNFYNENYRTAKAQVRYICKEGKQTWHPQLTFFGFRYLRLDCFPYPAKPQQFTAIAVYSDMERTGKLASSNTKLNQLFSNIIWGQKGNFLDVPTDCPQRDERLGWTGDAQIFIKAASYNFNVERFFRKWLHDLAAEQREDGSVGIVVPNYLPEEETCAVWGDAAVICPWQIYMMYGDLDVLREQFSSMKCWIDYITETTDQKYLWTNGRQLGDWLALDAPEHSRIGLSRRDFIASAYYGYSTGLLVKAGKALEKDVEVYERLHQRIVKAFRKRYTEYLTQTEYSLAICFDLAEDPQRASDELCEMIRKNGNQMQTGFVGTAYLLYALSRYGHAEMAYTLLLQEEYPSWLYSVKKGATTIWEHWDGIMENGEFWNSEMNSFNHYAYGAVAGWIYEEASGIQPVETAPGFRKIRIAPKPDRRLTWLEAEVKTRYGKVRSKWEWKAEGVWLEVDVPCPADIVLGEKQTINVESGKYCFWMS